MSSSREKLAGDFPERRIPQVSTNVKPELISKVNVSEEKWKGGVQFLVDFTISWITIGFSFAEQSFI